MILEVAVEHARLGLLAQSYSSRRFPASWSPKRCTRARDFAQTQFCYSSRIAWIVRWRRSVSDKAGRLPAPPSLVETFGYVPDRTKKAVLIDRAPKHKSDAELLKQRMREQPHVQIVPYDEILRSAVASDQPTHLVTTSIETNKRVGTTDASKDERNRGRASWAVGLG